MKSGRCEICGRWEQRLERHHERYKPEKTIDVCHKCHHKLHFLPWQLSDKAREKLLRKRHGYAKTITPQMIEEYTAPGRRTAQLEVRDRLKKKRAQATML